MTYFFKKNYIFFWFWNVTSKKYYKNLIISRHNYKPIIIIIITKHIVFKFFCFTKEEKAWKTCMGQFILQAGSKPVTTRKMLSKNDIVYIKILEYLTYFILTCHINNCVKTKIPFKITYRCFSKICIVQLKYQN